MRRIGLLILLGSGAVFGFASGAVRLWHYSGHDGWGAPWSMRSRVDTFAEACVRAARAEHDGKLPAAPAP